MHYEILGWPDEGVTLDLDYREFAYAGKFVMSGTGKAVAHEGAAIGSGEPEGDSSEPGGSDGDDDPNDAIVAAVAFDADRTDPDRTWLRYVTVRADRRGEGVGPRLVRYVTRRVRDRGATTVRIGVNNPVAYEALYRAGFGFTGEETGLAELVLQRPGDRSPERYRDGLDRYRDRDDLPDAARAFLGSKRGADPPDVVPVPE